MADSGLTCEVCGRVFGKRAKLQEHMLIHTGERPFQCPQCDKGFRRKSHLARHISLLHSQSGEKPHQCPQCDKSFALKHQLKRHMRKHEKSEAVRCEDCECGEVFESVEVLRVHRAEVHGGEAAYKCGECEYETNVKRDFKRHQRRKHAQKLYYCPHCPLSFPTWTLFLSHRTQVHPRSTQNDSASINGMWMCVHCDKCFEVEGKYKRHQQMHEGKWKCEECGKLLSSGNALKVHQRTVHEGEKPYVCGKCSVAFAHKHLLARHHRTKCPPNLLL